MQWSVGRRCWRSINRFIDNEFRNPKMEQQ